MRKRTVKGSILLEVIISIFFVAIVTLLIMFTIHTQLKINKIVRVRQELSLIARSCVSSVVAGEPIGDSSNHEVLVDTQRANGNIYKTKVTVKSKISGEVVEYETYFKEY